MGEATKTVAYVMDAPKAYEFTLRLGEARDTDDAAGAVLRTSELRPDDAEIEAALGRFLGHVMQTPPTYAAVKIQGERAYDIARRGDAVELAPREVRIDELELVGRPDRDHASFHMRCGKGAYVRAIARDLGQVLGCYAHVSALRRTSVGAFTLEQAVTLEALAGIVSRGDPAPDTRSRGDRAGRHPGTGRHGTAGSPAPRRAEHPRAAAAHLGRGRTGLHCPGHAVRRARGAGRFDEGELAPVRIFHLNA